MYPSEVIRFEGVTLGYPSRIALRNVSFSVRKGEFLGIIGPNGSGKSTLLKAILGLLRPFLGHIWVLGKADGAIRSQRHLIGYLPQREEIDPSFPATVMDVVLMGRYSRLGLLRRPGKVDREAVLKCLEAVDMLRFAHEPFAHLSGGQQQRVLVARALVQEPEILLLDEPTTAIDVAHQEAIVNIIRRIHKTRGLTTLMVTHDVNLISPWVDRLAYLNGKLYALGSPEEVLNEELLSRVYRAPVGVFREDGRIRVITGDHHA